MIKKVDVKKNKEYKNHEAVYYFEDKKVGLKGYIALHNTKRGPATGGTRLYAYKKEKDALADVLKLSRAMTYKCSFTKLPFGGGKAVIIAKRSQKNNDFLKSYAKIIDSFKGKYTTGTDVGITDEDTNYMSTITPYILKGTNGNTTTSLMAARGVYEGIMESYKAIFPKKKIKDMSIAIKGTGKIGCELIRLLYDKVGKIIASDIDEEKLEKIRKKYPKVKIVKPELIHKEKVDIYSPSAMGGEFNRNTIKELNCKIIVGGANNQFTNEKGMEQAAKLGIWYIPDYIVNSGGLIQIVDELHKGGYNINRVKKNIKYIGTSVRKMIKESQKTGLPPFKIAQKFIREKIIQKRT